MRVTLDTTTKREEIKATILQEIAAAIESHPSEYHPVLWAAMLREADMLVANNAASVPVIQAIVDNTPYTKLQVATNILSTDVTDRERLAVLVARQINETKDI